MNNAFNEIIKTARRKKGLKQPQIAKIMGLSVRAYQRREAGNITLSELQDLCCALDLSIIIVPKGGAL